MFNHQASSSDPGVWKKAADTMPCRVSTVVVQRFCKPKVGGSNPSPGTSDLLYFGSLFSAAHHLTRD